MFPHKTFQACRRGKERPEPRRQHRSQAHHLLQHRLVPAGPRGQPGQVLQILFTRGSAEFRLRNPAQDRRHSPAAPEKWRVRFINPDTEKAGGNPGFNHRRARGFRRQASLREPVNIKHAVGISRSWLWRNFCQRGRQIIRLDQRLRLSCRGRFAGVRSRRPAPPPGAPPGAPPGCRPTRFAPR